MSKLRLLFVKEAQASYISHLDLLRTIQRAFPRAGLNISHSQGYHPHPIISIVLPLPVGQSSDCELLDFEVTQETDGRGIADKLNVGMPCGLRVLDCYEAKRPVKELAFLQAELEMEYDSGVPEGAAEKLRELFARDALIIQKRTKRKELADVDIAPMIKEISFTEKEGVICADVTVQAQNPGLNPALLEKAIIKYLPECAPNFVRVRRKRMLDANGEDFR
ncbi:MAG: TIGR03936 family radical SAM-associated protein [Clostridiales bacterium]|nr:TIGR03936 family radical SAM-associated protein [Candidatus Cacconaster stercorequi]